MVVKMKAVRDSKLRRLVGIFLDMYRQIFWPLVVDGLLYRALIMESILLLSEVKWQGI